MKLRNALKLLLIFAGFCFNYSQEVEIPDVDISKVQALEVFNNEEGRIEGYYLVQQLGKEADRRLEFIFWDELLNEIWATEIQLSIGESVVSVNYNKDTYLISILFDKGIRSLVYNRWTGFKQQNEILLPPDVLKSLSKSSELGVFPIPEEGYILRVNGLSGGDTKDGLIMLGNDGSYRWVFKQDDALSALRFKRIMVVDQNVVALAQITTSVDALMWLRLSDGFQTKGRLLTDSLRLKTVSMTSQKNEKLELFGIYYIAGEKNSQGLFRQILNPDGTVVQTEYSSWKEDFAKYFELKNKNRFKSIGYLRFQDLLHVDGKNYAIAENFKFGSSFEDLALTVLESENLSSADNLKVDDIYAIEMDTSFKPVLINRIDLDSYWVGDWGTSATNLMLGELPELFNYRLAIKNKKEDSFIIWLGWERENYYGELDYLQYDKGTISHKTAYAPYCLDMLPAIYGKALVVYYSNKEKTLVLSLQELSLMQASR